MHWLLCAEGSEHELRVELAREFPGKTVESPHPGIVAVDFPVPPRNRLPLLAFSRQWLPNAEPAHAESINAWARLLFEKIAGSLPDRQPWQLHLAPQYGAVAAPRIGARAWHSLTRRGPQAAAEARREIAAGRPRVEADAGRHRCELICARLRETLRDRRRGLLRGWIEETAPFARDHSLVQLVLTSPDRGCLSVAPAPLPWEQRHLISAFPKGQIPVAEDQAAPSRAFAKLAEAELRLNRAIKPGETCVDLGAAPGSWTYWALRRGARVIAVDRAPLREDLHRHPNVRFQTGDAFSFRPANPVDWLLCDVIAPPVQSAKLLVEWVRQSWCRYFVVTLKMREAEGMAALDLVKRELEPPRCELFLTKLCSNKKEVCAFGAVARGWSVMSCPGSNHSH